MGPAGEVLAKGPYGEAAEELIVVQVNLTTREATGTAIAGMLSAKGYSGP